MDIKVVITNQTEIDCLIDIARENNLSVEQYTTNIVTGWLGSQIKDTYIGYIRQLSTNDLVTNIGPFKDLKKGGT